MLTLLFYTVLLAAVVSAGPSSLWKRQTANVPKAVVVTGCTQPSTVALTFDDGPYIYLTDISDTLTAANAIGTFFFNGNNYACIYDTDEMARIKYTYGKGHQIASHTWAHKDLTLLTSDEIESELSLVELALERILGVVPAFIRPPYGNYNDLLLETVYSHNQTVVLWDFDSGDSLNETITESEAAYDTTIATHPKSILALNHEVYETTAHQLLPYAIKQLQAAGFKLVSLADCLGMPAYLKVGSPGIPDATWSCSAQ